MVIGDNRYVHFQAGAIGQLMYLAAEASGLGATGIGAFYDGDARISGEILPEAEGRRRDPLIATPDPLQFATLGPVPVDAWLQIFHSMHVQIELDETSTGKIGGYWARRHGKDRCELRKRNRLHSTPEVQRRTPPASNIAEGRIR